MTIRYLTPNRRTAKIIKFPLPQPRRQHIAVLRARRPLQEHTARVIMATELFTSKVRQWPHS
jgi:hypothetical protein